MSIKITEMPWRPGGSGSSVFGANNQLVASVYPMESENYEQLEANIRLIASAPELLEALELANLLLSGANMNKQVVERKVKAAIAKATGATA